MNDELNYLISKKNDYSMPYYATWHTVKNFKTDMNLFPYPRFYRGKYELTQPVIMDRKAGYRQLISGSGSGSFNREENSKDLCFESACSVVLPCKKKLIDSKESKVENTMDKVYISI